MTTVINGRHTGLFPGDATSGPSPSVDYAAARRIQDEVNARLDAYARDNPGDGMDRAGQRQLAMHLIAEQLSDLAHEAAGAGRPILSDAQEDTLSQTVLAAMFGLGRFEQLLTDPQVEEIFISGASPATLRFADGHTETAQSVAESDEDLLDQLRSIATYHGQSERAVTSTRPFLDLRLPDGSRLAAVWAVTPYPEVTIRRHRFTTVTLDELTGMGMVSPAMAAFLTAAVQARRSVLIVGSPGAGKTTLLRALAQCLPVSERFATMETEHELLLHEIEGRFPLLVPYEARPGTGELDAAGRPAGEVSLADIFPASLRHGLQRILVGEVRGREVIPMLAAMSRGYRGSMATFHADSAVDTFEALASLLGEHKPNWNHAAAMAQIATALDLIVYVDTAVTPTGATARFVSDILEVGRVGENGQPAATAIFAPSEQRPDDPRGYPAHLPENTAWCVKAGLDLTWLTDANGTWPTPAPAGGGGR